MKIDLINNKDYTTCNTKVVQKMCRILFSQIIEFNYKEGTI